jgi:hypothetical protein
VLFTVFWLASKSGGAFEHNSCKRAQAGGSKTTITVHGCNSSLLWPESQATSAFICGATAGAMAGQSGMKGPGAVPKRKQHVTRAPNAQQLAAAQADRLQHLEAARLGLKARVAALEQQLGIQAAAEDAAAA